MGQVIQAPAIVVSHPAGMNHKQVSRMSALHVAFTQSTQDLIRHGMTRDWVAGLKLVTGTGELLDLNRGLIKNNAGYDLRQLVIGAEGTPRRSISASHASAVRPAKARSRISASASSSSSTTGSSPARLRIRVRVGLE